MNCVIFRFAMKSRLSYFIQLWVLSHKEWTFCILCFAVCSLRNASGGDGSHTEALPTRQIYQNKQVDVLRTIRLMSLCFGGTGRNIHGEADYRGLSEKVEQFSWWISELVSWQYGRKKIIGIHSSLHSREGRCLWRGEMVPQYTFIIHKESRMINNLFLDFYSREFFNAFCL